MSDYEKWQQIASEQSRTPAPRGNRGSERGDAKLMAVVIAALVLLAGDQVYVHRQVSQVAGLKERIEAQSAAQQEALNEDFQKRMAALDRAYEKATRGRASAERGAVQPDAAAASLDSTRQELKQTKSITEKLQAEQQEEASKVAHQLAGKADRAQVGALSQDVSATRQDLDSTRKSLAQAVASLGMARSEFGTLTGRNHAEIEQLRRLGERAYFEFALDRSSRVARVAGVGLELRKTDVKRLRYTLRLYADDNRIEKKDRTINEPVFFYVMGQPRPLELVVNRVESGRVTGYVSVPKGASSARNASARPADASQWEPFQELKSGTSSQVQGFEGPSSGLVESPNR